ncbi:TonB-dependent receptor plug domain-containing protein [Aquabacterium sp.]|uniref:TonB-dependent receptor plug domain-containing protein n=1 Tax=Aquabacterium sp. TaxID=1872578 RepID=UPI0037830CBC
MPAMYEGRVTMRYGAVVALLGLLAPAMARAQTAQELANLPLAALLDMEVSGASRFPTRRSESAAAVTVITREEIQALGHRTLSDVLRSVRGLSLSTDRTYDYVGVRGLAASGDYNTRVLLLVDGNRVNDALYDQAYLGGEFPLDLSLVERVEFVPGPGSAVYGANALFGVINVITRSAASGGSQLALGLGSQGERQLSGQWQQSTAGGGWRIAFSRSLRAGEALADPTPGAPAAAPPGHDAEQRSALHLRWDHGPWTATWLRADRRVNSPLGLGVVFGDAGNRYRDTLQLAGLQLDQALGGHEQLVVRVHAGNYRYLGDYLIDYPPPTPNRDVGRGRWWGLETRVTSTRFDGHRLVAGAEWQQTTELLQQNFDTGAVPVSYLDDRRRSSRGALFAEDQVRLGSQWTLHLGARVDEVQHYGNATSPRVALVWRPTAAWSWKLMHGGSFRAPNAYEAFYEVDGTAGYLRNAALRPEQVDGDELSAEWQAAPGWRLSGSLYRNRGRQLILLDYDASLERYRFDNGGSFSARGAEVELERASGALRWRVNASFNQDRSAVASLASPSLYPRRMLKGTLVLPLARGWRLGLEGDASSRRGAAPGQALLNLSLGGPLPALGANLQLTLRNLFDRPLQDPGGDAQRQPVLPQPGRIVRLELAWPFNGAGP